jgi:hypothetical protein
VAFSSQLSRDRRRLFPEQSVTEINGGSRMIGQQYTRANWQSSRKTSSCYEFGTRFCPRIRVQQRRFVGKHRHTPVLALGVPDSSSTPEFRIIMLVRSRANPTQSKLSVLTVRASGVEFEFVFTSKIESRSRSPPTIQAGHAMSKPKENPIEPEGDTSSMGAAVDGSSVHAKP